MNKKYTNRFALGITAAIAMIAFASAADAATTYRVKGPTQVVLMKRNAVPLYVGVRQVYTNGNPTTVSGSLVTNYVWTKQSMNARVYTKY